jgi:hypothetical protein
MFNPSEEDVILHKHTHSALVHPVELESTEDEDASSTEGMKGEFGQARRVTKREPLPEELQNICNQTQFSLSPGEMKELSQLLWKHKEVFQLKGDPLGRTGLIEHEIHTTGPPIRQGPRRF